LILLGAPGVGKGTQADLLLAPHLPGLQGGLPRHGAAAQKLFQREDDRPDSVKVRLETYEKGTAPLIEFYKGLGVLVKIAASGSPEEICEHTITALEDFRKRNSARERTWPAGS